MTEFKFGDVVIEHKNGHERKMVVTGKAFRNCAGLVVLAVYKGGTAANIVNVKNLTLVSRLGQGQRLESVEGRGLEDGEVYYVEWIWGRPGYSRSSGKRYRLVPADAEVSKDRSESPADITVELAIKVLQEYLVHEGQKAAARKWDCGVLADALTKFEVD